MTTLTMTLTTMRILTITTTMTTTTTTIIVDSTIITELNPQLHHLQMNPKLKLEHPQLLELLQNLEKKDEMLRGKRRKNLLFMRHLHGIIYN